MKIFTFYYNRYEDATTSIALAASKLKHTVLVHNEEQADKFKKFGTCKGELVVTGNGKGLANQRNSALDLMKTGEWAAFLCDDFQRLRSYPKEFILSKTTKMPVTYQNQSKLTMRKNHDIKLSEAFETFPKLIEVAEQNGVHLIGLALTDNPLSLANKFTTRGLADGRFWLVKKANYSFDLKAQLIDDVAWTAENLVRHGNVMVLNWMVPFFKRYSSGGFGTQEERIDLRRKECDYLIKKYHPLVMGAEKPGWPSGTHIRINGGDKAIAAVRKMRGGVYA